MGVLGYLNIISIRLTSGLFGPLKEFWCVKKANDPEVKFKGTYFTLVIDKM